MAAVIVLHALVGPGAEQELVSFPAGSTYQLAACAAPAPSVKSAAAMATELMVLSLSSFIGLSFFLLVRLRDPGSAALLCPARQRTGLGMPVVGETPPAGKHYFIISRLRAINCHSKTPYNYFPVATMRLAIFGSVPRLILTVIPGFRPAAVAFCP